MRLSLCPRGTVKVSAKLVHITSAEPLRQSKMQIIVEINGEDLDMGVLTEMFVYHISDISLLEI